MMDTFIIANNSYSIPQKHRFLKFQHVNFLFHSLPFSQLLRSGVVSVVSYLTVTVQKQIPHVPRKYKTNMISHWYTYLNSLAIIMQTYNNPDNCCNKILHKHIQSGLKKLCQVLLAEIEIQLSP